MELWTSLPGVVRYGISFGLISIALGIFFFADRVPLGFCGWLIAMGVVGIVLGPNKSDKNGYRF